jgi:hypothetical protein
LENNLFKDLKVWEDEIDIIHTLSDDKVDISLAICFKRMFGYGDIYDTLPFTLASMANV